MKHIPPVPFIALTRGEFAHPATGQLCTRFLLTTHTSPDGDAIGSIFAFAHLVTSFGAKVVLYLDEGVPHDFHWLPCPWRVVSSLQELDGFHPDVLAFFDCGDARRAGKELEQVLATKEFFGGGPFPVTTNIDHHQGNPAFADHNWVEAECAATAELVGALAEEAGAQLEKDLGEAVYLGLVSDTGKFTFPNTSPLTLAMASRIVGNGLDLGAFTRKREYTWSLARMHMWGELLQHVRLHHNGAIISSVVHKETLMQFGTTKNDLEDFADMLKRLYGVAVVLFVREEANGSSKISLRSVSGVDVRRVAESFGGGGHTAAAGANVDLPPETVCEKILEKLVELWDVPVVA